MPKFIAVVPGLRNSHLDSFDAPQETFELIKRVAAEFDINAHLLTYQRKDEDLLSFNELGRRAARGWDEVTGFQDLQRQYHDNGILLGNSFGGIVALEALHFLSYVRQPVLVTYGGILGGQKKLLDLFGGARNPQFIKALNGEIDLDVPVSGKNMGTMKMGQLQLVDNYSNYGGQPYDRETVDALKAAGADMEVVALLRTGRDAANELADQIACMPRLVIMAGEKDPYCTAADIEGFKAGVRPSNSKTQIVGMTGGDGFEPNREDYLREVLGAIAADRPVKATNLPAGSTLRR